MPFPNPIGVFDRAINRTTRSDRVLGPGQRLTPLEALQAMTIRPAHRHFEQETKGSIKPGRLADFVVLDRNPLTVPRATIKGIKVLETIKAGETVFKAGAATRKQAVKLALCSQHRYTLTMLAPTLYDLLKFLHITGVVMLMGNITVTAIWKYFADRDGRAQVLGFAQKLVTYTDWAMTVWGVILTTGGGYGMALVAGIDLFGSRWLAWSQGLFLAAGLIWLGRIVPLQIAQARMAREFASTGLVPEAYRSASRAWIFWGLVSTVPLVAATWLMVAKPA